MTPVPGIRAALAVAACAAAIAALGGTARATYPGDTNGRLAFGATIDGNTDIYTVLPNGQALRRLSDQPGFDACPGYSADGHMIAWCSFASPTGVGAGGVWVMKQNGTQKRQLTDFGTFPDISPDGRTVVFTGAPVGSTNPDIWSVGIDGTGLSRLTTAPGQDQFGAWSPDGTRIVFESVRTGVKQVWLMNADGSGQTELTFDATPKDQVPDWRPDGMQISYVERTFATGGDIWLMNADGSDQHPITSGVDKLGTAWSPDGTEIATLDWPTRTVEVIEADGTGARAVRPAGVQFVPGWQARDTTAGDNEP